MQGCHPLLSIPYAYYQTFLVIDDNFTKNCLKYKFLIGLNNLIISWMIT